MVILRCAAEDEVLLFDLAVKARRWQGEAPGRLLESTEKEPYSLIRVGEKNTPPSVMCVSLG